MTGGEIHRGEVDQERTEVWLDADDAAEDGRRAAVGLATDRGDRVYDEAGDLLAARRRTARSSSTTSSTRTARRTSPTR